MFDYRYPLLEVVEAIEQLEKSRGRTNVQVCDFVRSHGNKPNDPMKVLKTVSTLNRLVDEGVLIKKGKRYSFPTKPPQQQENPNVEQEEEKEECAHYDNDMLADERDQLGDAGEPYFNENNENEEDEDDDDDDDDEEDEEDEGEGDDEECDDKEMAPEKGNEPSVEETGVRQAMPRNQSVLNSKKNGPGKVKESGNSGINNGLNVKSGAKKEASGKNRSKSKNCMEMKNGGNSKGGFDESGSNNSGRKRDGRWRRNRLNNCNYRSRSPIRGGRRRIYNLKLNDSKDIGLGGINSRVFEELVDAEMDVDVEKEAEVKRVDYDQRVSKEAAGLSGKRSSCCDQIRDEIKVEPIPESEVQHPLKNKLDSTMSVMRGKDKKSGDKRKDNQKKESCVDVKKVSKNEACLALCTICDKKKRSSCAAKMVSQMIVPSVENEV